MHRYNKNQIIKILNPCNALQCLQVAIVHHLDMPIMRQRAFHIAPGTENQIPITPTLYTANPQVRDIEQKNITFFELQFANITGIVSETLWFDCKDNCIGRRTNHFVEIAKFQKILSNCPSRSKTNVNLTYKAISEAY